MHNLKNGHENFFKKHNQIYLRYFLGKEDVHY